MGRVPCRDQQEGDAVLGSHVLCWRLRERPHQQENGDSHETHLDPTRQEVQARLRSKVLVVKAKELRGRGRDSQGAPWRKGR